MDPVSAYRSQQERLGIDSKVKGVADLRLQHSRWAAAFDVQDEDKDGFVNSDEAQTGFQMILGLSAKMPTRKFLELFDDYDLETTGKVDFRQFVRITSSVSEYMAQSPKWEKDEEEAALLEDKKREQADKRRKSKDEDIFAMLGIKKSKDMEESEARKQAALERGKEASLTRLKSVGQSVLVKQAVVRRMGLRGFAAKRHASMDAEDEATISPSTKLRTQWERFGEVAGGAAITRTGMSRRYTIDGPVDLPQMRVGGQGTACFALRFSHCGSLLAGGFFDGGLRIYDVDRSELKHCLNLPRNRGGTPLQGEDSPAHLERAASNASARSYDDGDFNPLQKMREVSQVGAITNLRWRPGGGRKPIVATVDTIGNLKLWEVPTGRGALQPRLLTQQRGVNALNAVVFSEDGAKVVAGGTEKVLQVYDIEEGAGRLDLKAGVLDGKPLAMLGSGVAPPSKIGGHMLKVMSIVAHRTNPNLFISASLDKTVLTWDLRAGKWPVSSFYGPQLSGDACDISKDGLSLLTGSHRTNRPIEIYDLRMLPGFTERPCSENCARPPTPQGIERPSSAVLRSASLSALSVAGSRPSSLSLDASAMVDRGKGAPCVGAFEWKGNEDVMGESIRPTSCLLFNCAWDAQENKTIVASGESENFARIFELNGPSEPLRVVGTLWGKEHAFWSSCIAADGRNAAFGCADGGVVIVDLRMRSTSDATGNLSGRPTSMRTTFQTERSTDRSASSGSWISGA